MKKQHEELEIQLLKHLKKNPSAGVPYHNNDHMLGVWDIALQILTTESGNAPPSDEDVTVLMVTSLLHDYAHSTGKEPDSYNVQQARIEAKLFMAEHVPSATTTQVAAISNAIACTEYPFRIEPVTLVEKCMRDADILYPAMSGDPKVIMEGLRQEIETAKGVPVSYKQMLEGQHAFMKTVVLYTKSGQDLWDIRASYYLKRLQEYVENKSRDVVL